MTTLKEDLNESIQNAAEILGNIKALQESLEDLERIESECKDPETSKKIRQYLYKIGYWENPKT